MCDLGEEDTYNLKYTTSRSTVIGNLGEDNVHNLEEEENMGNLREDDTLGRNMHTRWQGERSSLPN